jgi:hypothetical protein
MILIKVLQPDNPSPQSWATDINEVVLCSLFQGDSWSQFERLVQGYAFADAQAQ